MLDQNLKQRLVGAAVLIGLGVVVIPLLLRGPAELSRDDGANGTESPSYSGAAAEPLAAKGGDSLKQERAPLAASSEQNRAPSTGLTSVPRPTKTPGVSSSPAKVPAEAGGWLVQIGSFTQPDNARRMRDEAVSLGYRAFIAPVTEGPRTIYRVQVGPEREAGRAKKLKLELEHRLHVKAFLISPSEG